MRLALPFHLLLIPAVLLAAACDRGADLTAPGSPVSAERESPDSEPSHALLNDPASWADGYLYADQPTGASYTPLPAVSYNRSGGTMTLTKATGTGRYVARFKGLSALIGNRNAVRVTASGDQPTYCKPVGAFLVRDSVEVRCYRMGTGAPVNATFFLQVVGKRDDRAFAFANQPAAAGYAVPSSGSWNPAGSTRVVRDAVGLYRVVFAGLGGRLPAGVGGHVQVNGVGGNRTYCKVQSWGGAPDLTVSVGCFTPAGAPADAKFSAVFTSPAAHLAYVWADSPVTAEYHAYSVYSSNPVGGAMTIYHYVTGRYRISWTGVGAEIRDYGNAQVTAYGEDGAQCQILGIDSEYVEVQCYAANGVPMDALYAVLLAS